MLGLIRKHLACGLLTLSFLTWSPVGLCQNTREVILDRPVRALSVEGNINLALAKMAYEYKVPIGLEVAQGGNATSSISINIKDGTLRDALDALVGQDSRYEWKLVDGVINVTPKTSRDSLLEDLLRTQVKNFLLEKGTSRWDIRRIITELPEVKTKLKILNVTPSIASWSNADLREAGPEFTLNLSDITVREILNQIIRTSDTNFWVVNRSGENREFIVINF